MDSAGIATQAAAMQAAQTQQQLATSMAKIAQESDQLLVNMLTESAQSLKMASAQANQAKGGTVA